MSRSTRLFALLHVLRRHRRPVSGKALAEELGVSIRTLYRDIASLQGQGAAIEGEPGVGYIMKPGFLLPPLMFTPEELEALVLGMRWVAHRGDSGLADPARSALARIAAVLPPELRYEVEASALLVATGNATGQGANANSADNIKHTDDASKVGSTSKVSNASNAKLLTLLRQAIRTERKLQLTYRNVDGALSQRTVWPFALAYFEQARVLMCWCELRQDFRYFRPERIDDAVLLDAPYAKRKQALLKAWRQTLPATQRYSILPETDSM